MPDASIWGWIAAGAVGGAFMFLLRWVLAHLESDLAFSRKVAVRGTELGEKGADAAEQRS